MTTTEQPPLAVVELFAAKTRRELLVWLLHHPDEWVTKAQLTEVTSVSRESIRLNIHSLREFGIVTIRDEDANIPHYRLADSPPVTVLQAMECSIETLTDVFAFTARQAIVSFFMDDADPDAWYSRYHIHEERGIGYEPLKEHCPVLVSHNVLHKREGSRSEEYTLADSHIVDVLYTLNEAVAETYQRIEAP